MKQTKEDVIFDAIINIISGIVIVVVLFPLINIVSRSFSSMEAVITARVWLWPVDLSLEGYKAIINYKLVWTGYINSIINTILGTIINISLTLTAAYVLSRKDFIFRKSFMVLFLITMLFNGGLIPIYIMVKNLGLLDKRLSLMLPMAINIYNVIVARTFFQSTIPDELLEASQLDGCDDFRFFFQVVLPLSGSLIAVISLWYAVAHWNSYFNALVYIRNEKLFPLQIVLRNILLANQVSASMDIADVEDIAKKDELAQILKYSLIIMASVPMLCLYPFIQKYFVKGVMIGSVKG
jgi:putative aldouronate transport system permease protein